MLIVWETLRHHHDLMSQPDYAQLQAKFGTSASSMEYLHHVQFNAEPYTALNAPLTEFGLWTLHEDTNKEAFQKKLERLSALVDGLPAESGVYRGGWGVVAEDERQFRMITGWENMEIFDRVVAANHDGMALVQELKALADLDVKHVIISKYSGSK
ncbi:hypothetical protein PHLCEN_2v5250 [Hermanssonia centrifuga]|uniref:ABM domain-containing protein n=1 Tax=Hermanssonia centrifuga TaxID=98765 RepID=A0A2R6P8N6_9APHY|nr:hypothetical protein PHLCEN_2v5250 [Hermanssonia centrifuga]